MLHLISSLSCAYPIVYTNDEVPHNSVIKVFCLTQVLICTYEVLTEVLFVTWGSRLQWIQDTDMFNCIKFSKYCTATKTDAKFYFVIILNHLPTIINYLRTIQFCCVTSDKLTHGGITNRNPLSHSVEKINFT